MVGHQHVGVQGAAAFFKGFAQPVTVAQVVLLGDEAGIAVMAALDNVQRYTGEVNAGPSGACTSVQSRNRAWTL